MFRLLNRFDLQDAYRLESKSFPADEAASLESIEFRITKAPDLIFGMLENDKLM